MCFTSCAQALRNFPMAIMRSRLYHGAFLALAFSVAVAGEARVELTCEQLFAVVKSALQYRDQGHSLQQVLAGLKSPDIDGKLSQEDVQTLRQAVTAVYLGNVSAEELAVECRETRSRVPK